MKIKRFLSLLECILVFCLLTGCGVSGTESKFQDSTSSSKNVSDTNYSSSTNGASTSDNTSNSDTTYIDPQWPTTDEELLSVPEKDRWYKARQQIGSRGTIVGPVIDVSQATGSKGQPIFINIGKNYPDPDRAQVVIWGDRAHDFQDILSEIDHGNAWVSVTGDIVEYNGVVEIDTDETKTKWLTWTDVQ